MIDLLQSALPVLHDLAQAAHLSQGGGDDSDGNPLWILAAGPVAAVAVYTGIWRYYRNTDKRHSYERETAIEAEPVTGSDQKVNEIHGTRNRRVDGDNVADYRRRVQRVPSDPEPR